MYAFGITLLEIATGQQVFKSASNSDIVRAGKMRVMCSYHCGITSAHTDTIHTVSHTQLVTMRNLTQQALCFHFHALGLWVLCAQL